MQNNLDPLLLNWPLGGLGGDGHYRYSQGNQSIRECLWNILLTRPGERLMRPEFGVGIRDFIHQPNNETTRHLLADVIKRGVERWERRIRLQSVEVSADPFNPAQVNITLSYILRNSGAADSLNLTLQMSA